MKTRGSFFGLPCVFVFGLLAMSEFSVADSKLKDQQSARVCSPLVQPEAIEEKYQALQNASSWMSSSQEKDLKKLLSANEAAIRNFSCYSLQGRQGPLLGDILTSIRLQILRLRYATFKKDSATIEDSLKSIRNLVAENLNESSSLARRLGANVRSLYLDELERLVFLYPQLVETEIRMGYWSSDLTQGMEKEILDEWERIKAPMTPRPSANQLAKLMGQHPWKVPFAISKKNKLDKLLHRVGIEGEQTLEAQLQALFRESALTVDVEASGQVIKHYLTLTLAELKKNNYFVIKPWLDPVIDEKVKNLKSELGVSYSMIFPLLGMSLEGPFQVYDQPIELFDSMRLSQAKIHFARVSNPIGRLYEIFYLKKISEIWSSMDVTQMKIDLNRLSFLKMTLAVSDYEKRYLRWPNTFDDLVREKLILQAPRDYFSGQSLHFDPRRRQIWSVGKNGINEQGSGDDFSLRLSL